MNERIRLLAEQAGYKHPDAVGTCEDYSYFNHEKFAELIVKECIRLCDQVDLVGADDCMDKIKEHFGLYE